MDALYGVNQTVDLPHILCGDFNFPGLFSSEHLDPDDLMPYPAVKYPQERLLTCLTDHLLMTQIVNQPTRQSNILDLVYVNDQDSIEVCEISNTAISDHNVIDIRTYLFETESNHSTGKLGNPLQGVNTYSCDFDNANRLYKEIDWENMMNDDSLDECFKNLANQVIDTTIALSKPKRNHKKTKFKRDRQKLWRRRRAILKVKGDTTLSRERIQKLETSLKEIDQEIQASFTNEEFSAEMAAINKIKENTKFFFSYAKRKSGTKNEIKSMKRDGNTETDPTEICQILQSQYCSEFNTRTPPLHLHQNHPHQGPTLSDIEISPELIRKEIMKISSNSSPGVDGISAHLLKKCADTLSVPLAMLWRKSMDSGQIPELCKLSLITPIFKKGKKDLPENYRPVSLTSHIIKAFERVITRQIIKFLGDNRLLKNHQHGFRKGRNCQSQLLEYYSEILDNMMSGDITDVIYLDYSKAFDKVNHPILLRKLESIGITGKLHRWISEFLRKRSQIVVMNGHRSDMREVLSGVPQGTVLGPLLFLIMVNDIADSLEHCSILSFADDSKLIKRVSSPQDHEKLQIDIINQYEWTEKNLLPLNKSKLEHVRFCPKNQVTQISGEYKIDHNTKIPTKHSVRDLGIHIDDDLSFGTHIENIHKKCRQLIGWIFRSFTTRFPYPMMLLWKSIILPRLEFCSPILSSINKGQLSRLEGLQRSFTSRLSHVKELSYWDRLKSLKIYSIQRRFERYLIILIWKMIEGKADPPKSCDLPTTDPASRTGRKIVTKIVSKTTARCKTLYHNSPIETSKRLFNSLPKHIRNVSNVSPDTFKSHLDAFLHRLPDKPQVPGYPTIPNSIEQAT